MSGQDDQRVGGPGNAPAGDDDAFMADADQPAAPAAAASLGNAARASGLTNSAASHATNPPDDDGGGATEASSSGENGEDNGDNGNDGGTNGAAAAAEKRKAIQAIMANKSLTDLERRLQIQRLMDGGRCYVSGIGGVGGSLSAGGAGLHSLPGATGASASAAGLGAAANSLRPGDHQTVACVHYDRKCHVVAPCCGKVFGCRVCHDEMSPGCGPMDRFAITEVVCKECGERQDSKTNACSGCGCGVAFAEYHCSKCNMWMALAKQPFHCDQCGFCRVGGEDNFRHCATCCMCVAASVYESHSCMADKYKNNCPVCREDMFVSRQSPQDLPCGHAIHAHCFRNLAGFDYRCPICKKTVVSQQSMSAAWRARARDIELQPMPPDLAREVDIACNDCERKSEGRGWHFLGVQCPHCSSFNTVVESMGAEGGGGGGGGGGSGVARGSGSSGSDGDAVMEP